MPGSPDEILARMPSTWQRRLRDGRRFAPRQVYLPLGHGMRLDAIGADGPAGSDPDLVERQLLAGEAVDFGMITPLLGNGPDPAFNTAVSAAVNAWQADTWLARDVVRLFGAICVAVDDVPGAVREIEAWSGHPGFKQVLIGGDGDRPFGHPQYDRIWAAASARGLPVAIHFNESHRSAVGLTPVGHFARQIDHHALAHPLEYASHLASWICAGTFDRHPDLRFVFLEGGFLWHRPVVRRLEHRWPEKAAHLEPPAKSPRASVLDHVRFASQPMEDPDDAGDLLALLEDADAGRLLVYSSDYPHYDFDAPGRVLPGGIDPEVRRRIMCETARELYGLPATRPRDRLDDLREAAR
jgi:uncharacterized protein